MCYECPCGDSTYILSEKSITDKTFQEAAECAGITIEEAKRNTYNLLKKELENDAIAQQTE